MDGDVRNSLQAPCAPTRARQIASQCLVNSRSFGVVSSVPICSLVCSTSRYLSLPKVLAVLLRFRMLAYLRWYSCQSGFLPDAAIVALSTRPTHRLLTLELVWWSASFLFLVSAHTGCPVFRLTYITSPARRIKKKPSRRPRPPSGPPRSPYRPRKRVFDPPLMLTPSKTARRHLMAFTKENLQ